MADHIHLGVLIKCCAERGRAMAGEMQAHRLGVRVVLCPKMWATQIVSQGAPQPVHDLINTP